MILERGKIYSREPAYYGSLTAINIETDGQNFMKPALFNATAVVNEYRKTCDMLASITKHISPDRMQFINPVILYGSDIFKIVNEREMFIRILQIMNNLDDVNAIEHLIPEDISDRLCYRNSDRSAELCVMLLNNDIVDLDNAALAHISKLTSKEGREDPAFENLEDFIMNLYAVNNTKWITERILEGNKAFSNYRKDGVNWLQENYNFLRQLMTTYFKPGELMRYTQTKGFMFSSIVGLLFMIRDRINLEYWNWTADIWLNLNLVGYNPTREMGRQWRSLNTKVNPGVYSGLDSSQQMELFVYAMNNFCGGLSAPRSPALNYRSEKFLTRFSDPQHVAHLWRPHTFSYRAEDFSDPRYDAVELLALAAEQRDERMFNSFNTYDEYKLSFENCDEGQLPAAVAAALIPAYTAIGKSLSFSEIWNWTPPDYDAPGVMDFIQYLYKHRGWLSKPQPVSIGRGRSLDIHPHTGLSSLVNSSGRNRPALSTLSWNSNPSITFSTFMEEAAQRNSETINGPDFIHLPDVVRAVLDDRFFHIASPFDLVAEGKSMQHCCGGDYYINECHDEERVFFHYQPETTTHWNEGVTFDLDMDLDDLEPFSLSSMNLFQNDTVPSEWRAEINKMIDKMNAAYKPEYERRKTEEMNQQASAA